MKIYKVNNTDVSKLFLPLRRLDKVDISRLKPNRDAQGTLEDMKKFLEDHHPSGRMVGFELNYENVDDGESETTFNFVTDREEYDQTLERFNSHHADDGSIESPDNVFIDVEEGDYIAVYDFDLTKDYWRPLNSYKNLQGGRDPLDTIITEMASRQANVDFKFQVISQPISEHRWKHRYPVRWMLKGISKDLLNASPLLFIVIGGIYMVLGQMGAGILFSMIAMLFFIIPLLNANTRTKMDFVEVFIERINKAIESLYHLPYWTTGLTYDKYANDLLTDDDSQEIQKIRDKSDRNKGFVTQVRLIAVGDNKNEVESYTSSVVRAIEETYRENDKEVTYPQGLQGKQRQSKDWALETGAEMVARDKGVDFNGRFTDKENLYWLKNSRRNPMILTPNELAGLMHFIKNTEHTSVKYH